MQFLLLICLMMACLPLDWPAPPAFLGTRGATILVGVIVVALLVTAAAISRVTCRAFRRHPDQQEAIAHSYVLARMWFFLANVAAFAASLLLLGWGWTVWHLATIENAGRRILVPGGELLVLAPFLVVQIGSWALTFDAARIIHCQLVARNRSEPFWSRWGFVGSLTRELALFFLPLILLITVQGFTRLFPELLAQSWLPLVSILGMVALVVGFPLLLPIILPLRPLPHGPIRERFEACARRIGFRYRRVYVWETRGTVANAFIAGIVPRLRYVILTDRLLNDLTDDELQAVIGHEMGHAWHGHLLYYMFFFLASVVGFAAFAIAIDPPSAGIGRNESTESLVLPTIAMGLYLFVAFGFISRRCERQADIFGCRAGSCLQFECSGHVAGTQYAERGQGLCTTGINAFIAALNKVVGVNSLRLGAVPQRETSAWRKKLSHGFKTIVEALNQWLHSTVAKRTAFLLRVIEQPDVERRFQRRFYVMRWAIAIAIVGVITVVGFWRGWDTLWHSL